MAKKKGWKEDVLQSLDKQLKEALSSKRIPKIQEKRELLKEQQAVEQKWEQKRTKPTEEHRALKEKLKDWDRNFQKGSEMLEGTGTIDTDAARAARLSGEACFAKGQSDRALKALQLSLSNYQRMEREEDAAIVLDIIEEVEAMLARE